MRRGKPSIGAQIEGAATVNSGARESVSKLPPWTKDAARDLFMAQTVANGGILTGGFGFLSPALQTEWSQKAYDAVMHVVEHRKLPPPPYQNIK